MSKGLLGLDLGFQQTKVFSLNAIFKYLSMIGNPSAFELEQIQQDKNPMNNLVVNYNNETIYVGRKALETNNARLCTRTDKTNTENDMAGLFAALGHLYKEYTLDDLTIVTGLPVEDFKQEGLTEQLVKNIKGNKKFKFGKENIDIDVKVSNVIVIPQSAGAFFNYVLDEEGQFIESRLKVVSGETIVIDIGYKTTDIITMKSGKYISEKSCTIEKGMKDIHKELQRLIRLKYNRKFSLSEMDDICKSREFNDKGKVIKIDGLIAKAERPIASAIINEAYALVGDTREADKVLACGGTMELLYPYFFEYYNGHIEKLEDLEYANASGYFKFGRMKLETRSKTKSKE